MIVTLPRIGERPRCLEARVLAYVNEPAPAAGQDGLRAQMRAVAGRARRDGIAVGLLVVESGGRQTDTGRGMRLEDVLEAARRDRADRVLYVAHPTRLAGGPEAVLRAMEDVFAAGFELRAPCGRISPKGRTVAALRAAAAASDRTDARGTAGPVGRGAPGPGTDPEVRRPDGAKASGRART